MATYAPATRPTLHFIGVTTGQSSIMRVFPAWARHLGIDAAIRGIDLPLRAGADAYREAAAFVRDDPLSRGALVTTHKIDLFHACRDMFDKIDPLAALMGETSCLSKPGGRFACHAKDPISSGLALDGFLPDRHFAATGGDLFVIGAGGSAIAITWHLMQAARGDDRPSCIVVSDTDPDRLSEIRRIHEAIGRPVPVEYLLARGPEDNDRVMERLAPASLVVNATGLGKDAPGSPITGGGLFPEDGIAFDLNYRGDLVFLDQAKAQQAARGLQIENGWTYFIHGWTQVIAEVFAVPIPTSGPGLERMSAIAADPDAAP